MVIDFFKPERNVNGATKRVRSRRNRKTDRCGLSRRWGFGGAIIDTDAGCKAGMMPLEGEERK